jgi:hypothetical protein
MENEKRESKEKDLTQRARRAEHGVHREESEKGKWAGNE